MLVKLPNKISKFDTAQLAYAIIEHFHYSQYPKRTFDVGFTDGEQDELTGEIQIRIPHSLPILLREKVTQEYLNLKDSPSYQEPSPGNHYRVIPAIESFVFPIPEQRDYLLEMIIYCLAKMESTRYIVMSNVGCETLENNLRESGLWEELHDEYCAYILPAFYVSSKAYIAKFRNMREEAWELIDALNSSHSNFPLIKNNNSERGITTKANLSFQAEG